MKPLVFKASSWHFWLANLGDYNKYDRDGNLCSYTRAVAKGLLVVAVVAVVALALLYWVGDTIAWWVAIAQYGYIAADGPVALTMFGVVLGGSASIAYVASGVVARVSERRYQKYLKALRAGDDEAKPDGFLLNAWRSLREKTCVRVVIESAANE